MCDEKKKRRHNETRMAVHAQRPTPRASGDGRHRRRRPLTPAAIFSSPRHRGGDAAAAARALNRGALRLYLDSASPLVWDAWAPTGMVYGLTTNPAILLKDGARGCDARTGAALWRAAKAAGARELQLQATGTSAARLLSTGLALAAIDDAAIVVKVPATRAGCEAAAKLKDAGARVTLTAIYTASQALVGAAIGVDYVAPYLGRINDSGRDGLAEVAAMQAALETFESSTRVLVASVRAPTDVVALAGAGVTTFTLSPDVLAAVVGHPSSDDAAAAFEEAAAQLGAVDA